MWEEGLGRSGRWGGSESAAATQRSPRARGAGLGPRFRRPFPNCAPRLRQTAGQVQRNGLRFIFPPRVFLGRAGHPSHPKEGQSPLSCYKKEPGTLEVQGPVWGRFAQAPGAQVKRGP